jgi:glycosyltransferase involved in cell wall biosynthesis
MPSSRRRPQAKPALQRRIYMACPMGPIGGGMARVVDYLIDASHKGAGASAAPLVALDTRGQGSAARSLWVLLGAMRVLVAQRKDVAGVHIHLAERLSLLRKGMLMLLCKALGLPMVVHLHAAQFAPFYRQLPAPARWLTRRVLQLPAGQIVLGQRASEFMTDEIGVPAQRVHIVPNGVPAPLVARRRDAAVRHVLFVGNLSERKGVSDLLRALGLPGWDRKRTQVLLAGGGDVQSYRAQAQAMGLDPWLQFTGWLGPQQVAQRMAQADVLVLPSYDEGLPLVILEAMAQGVAVVCTPVGEIAQFITDEQEALFVQPGDSQALARQIQRVLADDALRSRLETAGQQLYARRFSMERFCAEIARLHEQHFDLRPHPAKAPSPRGRGSYKS